MPISKADKKIWTDALRSGEYKQCRGKFYDGEGYCCLGVAAKVLLGIPEKEMLNRTTSSFNSVYQEWSNNIMGTRLASKNDSLKWDFKEIADWLDINLETSD